MAVIVAGNSYRFKSKSDNRYLNILTDGALSNNKNVTTYALDSSDLAQVWLASVYTYGSPIQYLLKSAKDNNFVLDRWRGSSNYNNADIYTRGTTTDDLKDQVIVFVASGSYYKIKLANYDLYLTVTTTSTYGGYNVNWQAATGADNQLWLAETYTSNSSGSSGTAPTWNLISPPTSINNVDIMATYNAPLGFTGGYYTVDNIPDKLWGSGIETGCKMHKGSGFKTNVSNFQTTCLEVIDAIADAVEVMYGHRNFDNKNICYFLFGEYDSGIGIHHGVDMAIAENSPIKALISGTVAAIDSSSGKVVINNEDGQTCSCYYHMNTITVNVNDPVVAGVTQIGTEGKKGQADGSHLHFEIRKLGKTVGAAPEDYNFDTALTSIVPYGFMKKAVEIYNYNK